jgi:hypothetical protein
MIGPHEGHELELMIKGLKPLAAFSDFVPQNGIINETIIPEKAFLKYTSKGTLIRISADIKTDSGLLRIVCFCPPDQIWRAKNYIFLREKIHTNTIVYTNTLDEIFGHLLGYSPEDIENFIES